jgi:hypothetical protein
MGSNELHMKELRYCEKDNVSGLFKEHHMRNVKGGGMRTVKKPYGH